MFEHDDTFSSSSQKTSDLALILGGAFLLFGMVFLVLQDVGFDDSPLYINEHVLDNVTESLVQTNTLANFLSVGSNNRHEFINFYASNVQNEIKQITIPTSMRVLTSSSANGYYFYSKEDERSYLVYDSPEGNLSKFGVVIFNTDSTKVDTFRIKIIEYLPEKIRDGYFYKSNILETNGIENRNYWILNEILSRI